MTANTWPFPARPGVPLNPEKDGWHWVKAHPNNLKATRLEEFPAIWTAGNQHWIRGTYPPEYAAKNWIYLGPVLAPDEAAALQARADRNAAGFARVDAEAERAKFLHKQEIAALQKRVAELEGALREMVYEATHLSPEEDDGSHWCKINKGALVKARAALTGGKDE